jgi:hypothetical protein
MPKKPKAPSDRPPVYVTYRPDLEELKSQAKPFAHPRIQVGHRYGDDDLHYFFQEFTVEFQVSLRPNPDGTTTNGGHAYGGTVEHLPLDQAMAVLKTIERVRDEVKLPRLVGARRVLQVHRRAAGGRLQSGGVQGRRRPHHRVPTLAGKVVNHGNRTAPR